LFSFFLRFVELARSRVALVEDINIFTRGLHRSREGGRNSTIGFTLSKCDGFIQVGGDFSRFLEVHGALEALEFSRSVSEDHDIIAEGGDVRFEDLLATLVTGDGGVAKDVLIFVLVVSLVDLEASPV